MAYDTGTDVTSAPYVKSLLGLLAIGTAVSLSLGVYGNLHEPTGIAVNVAGFSGPQEVKVWLASATLVGAITQLVSALMMYGRLPGLQGGHRTAGVHRWSGRIAFLLSIPVAMHCLYALGFQSFDTRVLVHSVVGCLCFGAFTVKMLSLTRPDLPGWVLPSLGALVFTTLVLLWLTSSFWFFTTVGVRL